MNNDAEQNTDDTGQEPAPLLEVTPVRDTGSALFQPASGAGAPGAGRGGSGGTLAMINGVLMGVGGVYAVSSSIPITAIAAVVMVVVIALTLR